MDKKLEKFIIKIQDIAEKILKESHVKEITLDGVSYGNNKSWNMIKFGGYGKSLTVSEFGNLIRESLYEEDSNVYMNLSHQTVKTKSILNFLYKEDIQSPLLDKIFNIALNPVESHSSHDDVIKMAEKINPDFGRKIALLTCQHSIRHHLEFNLSINYSCSGIIGYLKKYKFHTNEIPHIKTFLNHYRDVIKSQYYTFNEKLPIFIKQSIPQKHWKEFAPYLSNPKELTIAETKNDTFCDDNRGFYNLIINNSSIKSKYPHFTFDRDYKVMIDSVIGLINSHKEKFHLYRAQTTHWDDNNVYAIFFSQDETYPDKIKIKNTVSALIEAYHENIERFTDKSHLVNHLNDEFDKIILSVKLEEQLEKKAPTKKHKI